jgi:hypothetical protein
MSDISASEGISAKLLDTMAANSFSEISFFVASEK